MTEPTRHFLTIARRDGHQWPEREVDAAEIERLKGAFMAGTEVVSITPNGSHAPALIVAIDTTFDMDLPRVLRHTCTVLFQEARTQNVWPWDDSTQITTTTWR